MFKVGDKVRRVKNPVIDIPIGYEGIVEKVPNNCYIKLKGICGSWNSISFELVEEKPKHPCIRDIPPVPARKEIVPGPIFEGSFIHFEKHNHLLHLYKPYWMHQPAGGMSIYWDKEGLIKFRDALTEIIKVIEENEKSN